jgi:hypothetical protein
MDGNNPRAAQQLVGQIERQLTPLIYQQVVQAIETVIRTMPS